MELFTPSQRAIEKIFSHSRLALRVFDSSSLVMPNVFVFLVYLKVCHSDIYEKLKAKEFNVFNFQSMHDFTIFSVLGWLCLSEIREEEEEHASYVCRLGKNDCDSQ